MSNVKTVRTSVLKYAKRIRILTDEYEDGNLHIGLYTMSGEPYMDITTNMGYPTEKPYGFVLQDSEAEAFVREQKLGENTHNIHGTTFNTYRMYRFNV